ncbi:hypothetical protein DL98DRAFT_528260 [Cadophora sp. DSE1049]|nr:hypothetical protein DL98DRAFT_528260 [Cadophora sp. DSE1049]
MPSTSRRAPRKGKTKTAIIKKNESRSAKEDTAVKDTIMNEPVIQDAATKDVDSKNPAAELSIRKLSLRTYSAKKEFDMTVSVPTAITEAGDDKTETTQEDEDAFDKFTLFPKLPLELRLIIWTMVANMPRVLQFYARQGMNGQSSCLCKAPSVLQATHESRSVALKFYVKAFTNRVRNCSHSIPTYINYSADIVFVSPRMLVRLFVYIPIEIRSALRKVQNIMLRYTEDEDDHFLWQFFRSAKTMVLQTPTEGLDPTGKREKEIKDKFGVPVTDKWERGSIEVEFMTEEEMVNLSKKHNEVHTLRFIYFGKRGVIRIMGEFRVKPISEPDNQSTANTYSSSLSSIQAEDSFPGRNFLFLQYSRQLAPGSLSTGILRDDLVQSGLEHYILVRQRGESHGSSVHALKLPIEGKKRGYSSVSKCTTVGEPLERPLHYNCCFFVQHLHLVPGRGHGFVIASELAAAKVKVSTCIPGVLHAVQDSRAIALKYYQIAFEDNPRVPTMFFNYDLDYLHISPPLLESLFTGPAMKVVKEQTLSKVCNSIIGPSCQLQHNELDVMLVKFFRSLKHVIIPHKFPLGDPRRVRKENTGREYFKHDRCTKHVNLPGMDVEYKTMMETRELSRAMRRGD